MKNVIHNVREANDFFKTNKIGKVCTCFLPDGTTSVATNLPHAEFLYYDFDNGIKYNQIQLKALHNFTRRNKTLLVKSNVCGCFYCGCFYDPKLIKEFYARKKHNTAICPMCSVDTVLPGSLVKLSPELLEQMHERWFRRLVSPASYRAEEKAFQSIVPKLTYREKRVLTRYCKQIKFWDQRHKERVGT